MTDLPNGWEWATLGQIVDVLDHKRIPVSARERDDRRGDVPYYGATGQVGWIDEPLFEESLTLLGEDGAPFLDRRRPKAYSISGPTWVNNHVHVLRPVGGIGVDFLTLALNAVDYSEHVTGTTRLKLPKSSMLKIPVPVPPVAEQVRIVEAAFTLLESLDDAARALRVCRSRSSTLRNVAVRRALWPVSTRPAPALLAAGADDGDLPAIPESWCWKRLDEVADVTGGVTKDSSKQSDPEIPLVSFLRVANVQRGYLKLEDVAQIRASARQVEKLRLRPGDVLLNEGGDRDKLGRGWVWEGQIEDCIHQNHVFRARIRNNALHPKILAWHANHFGGWFERNGKQSVNLASISLTMIKQLPVPVPPRDEQDAIVASIEDALASCDRLDDLLVSASSRSDSLKAVVLEEASAGRLVPQDRDDMPASVLLDRIRNERAASPPRARRRSGASRVGR